MELHEAVLAYRADIVDALSKLDPRPPDEWIAETVDALVPIEVAGEPERLR
jgi:hypothetical protein